MCVVEAAAAAAAATKVAVKVWQQVPNLDLIAYRAKYPFLARPEFEMKSFLFALL